MVDELCPFVKMRSINMEIYKEALILKLISYKEEVDSNKHGRSIEKCHVMHSGVCIYVYNFHYYYYGNVMSQRGYNHVLTCKIIYRFLFP